MRIAVVGSGHGGCAMAAVLAMRGHDVRLVKLSKAIHNDNFDVLKKRGIIKLTGIEGEGEFALDTITTNPASAIVDAEVVLIYYVANYHRHVADALTPYFNTNQSVILNPGYAGSLIFHQVMKQKGYESIPVFAEFETLPYSSRIVEPGHVDICSRNVRHPFATYPASRVQETAELLYPILGDCVPRKHILEVALHNPNLVIHTTGVLLNASLVEDKEKTFSMYRDGFSESIWRVVDALDKEKMDVLEWTGAERISYFDEFRLRTFIDNSIDPLVGFAQYASEAPGGPFSIDNRYITEDVPIGLGLLHSLGQLAGINTPICDSMINLASCMLQPRDLWAEARTIQTIWNGSADDLMKELVV